MLYLLTLFKLCYVHSLGASGLTPVHFALSVGGRGDVDEYATAITPHPWRLTQSLRCDGGALAVS
jgi:hypothetical protein